MADKSDAGVAKVSEAVLSDEALTEWEKRIGLELRVGSVFNQTVSPEAIRNMHMGVLR